MKWNRWSLCPIPEASLRGEQQSENWTAQVWMDNWVVLEVKLVTGTFWLQFTSATESGNKNLQWKLVSGMWALKAAATTSSSQQSSGKCQKNKWLTCNYSKTWKWSSWKRSYLKAFWNSLLFSLTDCSF